MAKRTCARAEGRARERAPARKPARAQPPSPRRYVYTPALLAHGRHRYEHTEDSIPDIALDFGIHKTTLQRLAKRERQARRKNNHRSSVWRDGGLCRRSAAHGAPIALARP